MFVLQVCKEKHRFERLMDYFRSEEGNIDFMVRQASRRRHVVCVFTCRVQAGQFALVLSPFLAPGCLHAVHQHCGPLSGRYELQSSSAVRVHQTGPG